MTGPEPSTVSGAPAPVPAWRGPVLDWLQHLWVDETPPAWAERTMLVYERRVAVVSGFRAAQVQWDVVRGLGGPTRVTRLDLCVDVVLPGFTLPARRPGEHHDISDTGETKYFGSDDSELQWKLYRWADYTENRPFLWLQQADAAGADLNSTWRIELRARGRRARWLAEAENIGQAWAWAQTRLPEGWPVTSAAQDPPECVNEAMELAADELAERLYKYIESQARRYGKRVGLDAASTRHVLADLARRTLGRMAGNPERWLKQFSEPRTWKYDSLEDD